MSNFVRINFQKKSNRGGIRHMKDFNVKFEESLPSNFLNGVYQRSPVKAPSKC
jgi:hypothetical protein